MYVNHKRQLCDIYNVGDNYKYRGFKMKELTGVALNKEEPVLTGLWQNLPQRWSESTLKMIDGVIGHFMTNTGVRGASLAIAKDEKLIYAKGFGKMDDGEY